MMCSGWRPRALILAAGSAPLAPLVSVLLGCGVAGVWLLDVADRAGGGCCGRCAAIFSGWGCRSCEEA